MTEDYQPNSKAIRKYCTFILPISPHLLHVKQDKGIISTMKLFITNPSVHPIDRHRCNNSD